MTTTNLGMTIPTVGADTDNWGNDLNADLQKIDDAFTVNRYTNFTTTSIFVVTSSTAVMGGFGTDWKITPSKTGRVRVCVTGCVELSNSLGTAAFQVKYGTSTAPIQGSATIGTSGTVGEYSSYGAAMRSNFAIEFELSGLTLSTPIWLDLSCRQLSSGTCTLTPISVLIEEIF